MEIGFSSLYEKRLSKIYSVEKVHSLGMGEETEENLMTYIWKKKNVDLVIKSLVREVSDNCSVGMGKGKG